MIGGSYIASERIEAMKAGLDFPEYLSSCGVEWKRSGRSVQFDCPGCGGHRKASAIDRDGVWIWKCFKCDAKGTCVEFEMARTGSAWIVAVKSLLEEFER